MVKLEMCLKRMDAPTRETDRSNAKWDRHFIAELKNKNLETYVVRKVSPVIPSRMEQQKSKYSS